MVVLSPSIAITSYLYWRIRSSCLAKLDAFAGIGEWDSLEAFVVE
jgi:hypothetical protein